MGAYTVTDACVGCTLCARRCPVGAVAGRPKEKHAIDAEVCIGCGLCGRLCARGAILDGEGNPARRIPGDEWLRPQIDADACAGCSVCIVNCPAHCLKLTEPERRGDIRTVACLARETECIGCGRCAGACPIGAIVMWPAASAACDEGGRSHMAGLFSRMWCRTFQGVMKVANYFLGYRMPEYIEGAGSIRRLPEMMREKGADNVLVVTDGNLIKLGLPDGLLAALKEGGFRFSLFSDIAPNPTSDDVEAGFRVYREQGCQALVAFGGGAPMDCAKAIAAKAVHPRRSVAQLQGVLKVHKRIPLFFAVPTTAGTGSETTVAAVITDAATHRKAAINDPCIIPKYAVLDPELTMGLPPFVTATTGLDALCHAVEAYTNHTYNTALENTLAKEAVRLVHGNLLMAYRHGDDPAARQNMQKAAFFAGRAFTRGCVGYVHAVGHTLGGLYGVPHGLAMSVLLPHVMRQFGAAVHRRLAELADVCGMAGGSDEEKAEAFLAWIEEMQRGMQIPRGFDCIREEDVPQIIAWAKKEANPLYPVPVIWGDADFRRLLETVRLRQDGAAGGETFC